MLVPKAGLEPAWVSPHAPQTCVSAIPPLRHEQADYETSCCPCQRVDRGVESRSFAHH
jgi:hypothetical protein